MKEVETEPNKGSIVDGENVDEEKIINLISKNMKSKKKIEQNVKVMEKGDKIYNVTINNYIKPNINILN